MSDIPSNATPVGMNVTVGGNIAPLPNGKHQCILIFATEVNSFQLALPPSAADNLGDTLGPMLKDLAAQARRADTGLVTAPASLLNGGKTK